MTTLSIREVERGDADRVWAVHEAAFRASPIEFVEDADADEDLRHLASRYLDGSGEFLVGEVDGIVAIGGYEPRDGEVVEVRRMRVHPDHQRRGFGRALLRELEERARARGFETAVLETHEALEAAIGFYEANGYDEVAREFHPVAEADFVRFEKDL